jgi:hypothetical protein
MKEVSYEKLACDCRRPMPAEAQYQFVRSIGGPSKAKPKKNHLLISNDLQRLRIGFSLQTDSIYSRFFVENERKQLRLRY